MFQVHACLIEKLRLGTEEYYRIVSQAQQNGVQTYHVFYYEGEEKLRVFYYGIETSTWKGTACTITLKNDEVR